MASDPPPEVVIWTDGGCKPNPGPGGWAAILQYGAHVKEVSGAAPATTNNRMELTAAIEGLSALKRPARVLVMTDSQYVRDGITRWLTGWVRKGWKTANRDPVKNYDLWQALLAAMAPHQVRWEWVRGHAGEPMNERADQLATEARERQV